MSDLHPAIAEVRRAVRGALADLDPGTRVLVAVSGGADSMALAAAAHFVAERAVLQPMAIVVDHQLQEASGEVASSTADRLRALGYEDVVVSRVEVDGDGGPEAAARSARYRAIDEAADAMDAAVVLLGHTRDDQAESVLLGLARGSGAGSIKGMSPVTGRYRRPLLGVSRDTTRAACAAMKLEYWDDPHNVDDKYARVRVRQHVMPVLESELGPGVAAALARTAELLQSDDDALNEWANEVAAKAASGDVDDAGHAVLDAEVFATAPAAVRTRVLRRALLAAGVPGGDLRASQIADVDALVSRWRGQGEVHLPGGIRASRSYGRLLIARAGARSDPEASR
ncbi:MAG TPA: tRNA lysidine(34) synthetase TilS [Actinomycetes bacterium]|nr:tRNA lysidine(34) synthetase TilS [Actinomycetes bacterium]